MLVNTNICVVGHEPRMWLQSHGLQCLVTVIAAVILLLVAVLLLLLLLLLLHTHFCSHKHKMFIMLLGHVWWCW